MREKYQKKSDNKKGKFRYQKVYAKEDMVKTKKGKLVPKPGAVAIKTIRHENN